MGGGGNSIVENPLGSVGEDLGIGPNTVVGDIIKYGNPVSGLANQISKGADYAAEGIGEITGANAMRKAAMDQQSANEAEMKRQGELSDAMAKAAGGDPTQIFIGRSRRGGARGGGGSAGQQTAKTTGVQR